ncbi:phage head closure protein [Paenibacillus sp. TAF43_2]|uniref:phage head closure protein n=1 Tax=Paenibacillus sp. TAF43_2 TaxID=3233069 RepID=UPI003F986D6E
MTCAENKNSLTFKLRHKITIKKRQPPQDEYGASLNEWVTVKTIWSSKEPLLGREYFAAEAAQSLVEVKFRCRFTKGIENEMRVYHGSDVYDILSVIDVMGQGRELLIYVKRVSNG